MFTHHTSGSVFDEATQADAHFSISFHSTSDFTYFYVGRMHDSNQAWWPIDFHASNGSVDPVEAQRLAWTIASDSLRRRRAAAA